MLTFQKLREVNIQRDAEIFNHLARWTPEQYACAVAGETGEMCNLVKKQFRGDTIENLSLDIGKEIADIVIYCDLLAAKYGYSLEQLIINKFNEVSKKRDCSIILPTE